MKKMCCAVLVAIGLLMSTGLFAPAMSDTQVRINVDVPLPQLVIPAPPALIPIPGVNVYYPPDVDTDVFFYHDQWYRPHRGKWYRARSYNGPWKTVGQEHVPGVVRGVPHSFRGSSHGYERIPYEDVRRNHRAWERDHRWDKNERRIHDNRVMKKERPREISEHREQNVRVMQRDHREINEHREQNVKVMQRDPHPKKQVRGERMEEQKNNKHNGKKQ